MQCRVGYVLDLDKVTDRQSLAQACDPSINYQSTIDVSHYAWRKSGARHPLMHGVQGSEHLHPERTAYCALLEFYLASQKLR
jgi:hypothetical protein